MYDQNYIATKHYNTYIRMYHIICVQKWRKGWVVMNTKELLNFTIEYYKDEDQWLSPSKSTKKITISEPLRNIVNIKHMHSSYKCHVMGIIFDNFSILISFKPRTTMESWISKLNNIRGTVITQLCTFCIVMQKIFTN